MASDLSSQFVDYLRQGKHLTAIGERGDPTGPGGTAKLWELADLSANEFAEAAAHFHGLERVTLQDMMSAVPLAASFSSRFLRETLVFPYRSPDGYAVLAVADPTDQAAQRAAQIVLGAAVAVKVATSEDLAVVLDRRLDQHEADAGDASPVQLREDDIESLRDLASGAPVVRAVNDLLEKAVE
jgi:general secretion pathway protein E